MSEKVERARAAIALLNAAEKLIELASGECGRFNYPLLIRTIQHQQQRLLKVYDKAKEPRAC